jgi:hypothetical protein
MKIWSTKKKKKRFYIRTKKQKILFKNWNHHILE